MHLLKNNKQLLLSLLVIGIVVIAIFTRFYELDITPTGGDTDSSWVSLEALNWIDYGIVPHFVYAIHGPEPLIVYLVGLLIPVVGIGITTARIVTASSAVCLAVMLFVTNRALLRDVVSEQWRMVGAILAMSASTFSLHLTEIDRLGIQPLLLPLTILITLWLTIEAWEKGGWWRWVIAGIALAINQYTYLPGRIMALVAIVWFVHSFFADRQRFKAQFGGWVLMAFTALIVAMPNVILFLTEPGSFTNRLDTSANANTGTLIWQNDLSEFGGLIGFLAQKAWLAWLTVGVEWDAQYKGFAVPVLLPIFYIGFLVGVVYALRYFRQIRGAWLLMPIPILWIADAVTSISVTPSPTHLTALLPFIFLLSGTGLMVIGMAIARWIPRLPMWSVGIATSLAIIIPYAMGFNQFFNGVMPALRADPDTAWRINQTDIDISNAINAHPERAYLLPYGEYTRQNTAWLVSASYRDRHSILGESDFTISTLPETLTVVLPTDPQRARHDLGVEIYSTRTWVLLVDGQTLFLPMLTADQETTLLDAVTDQPAEAIISPAGTTVANFHTITLGDDFFAPALNPPNPMLGEFAHAGQEPELRLIGYQTNSGSTPQANDTLRVTLYWQVLRPIHDEYEIFVQLWDDQEQVYGSSHDLPIEGVYSTRLWRSGEIITTQHTLFLTDNFPQGRYRLAVGLYHPLKKQTLSVQAPFTDARQRVVLAPDFRVAPEQAQPSENPLAVDLLMGDLLRVDGLSLTVNQTSATPFAEIPAQRGDTLSAVLTWEVLARPTRDYSYFLHLIPTNADQPIAQADGALGDQQLPSGAWFVGDYWQTSAQMTLPNDAPNGSYQLWLGIYYYADGERLMPMIDGQAQANGRVLLGTIVITD